MVNVNELLKFESLHEFSKDELIQLSNIGSLQIFSQGEKIFSQNTYIENLYLMLSGEISLTYEINKDITLIITNVKPGVFFGISALCNVKTSQNAYCDKTSEVVSFPVNSLVKLFNNNLELGSKFTLYLLKFYHKIAQSKTQDFLKYLNSKSHIKDELSNLSFLDFSL